MFSQKLIIPLDELRRGVAVFSLLQAAGQGEPSGHPGVTPGVTPGIASSFVLHAPSGSRRGSRERIRPRCTSSPGELALQDDVHVSLSETALAAAFATNFRSRAATHISRVEFPRFGQTKSPF